MIKKINRKEERQRRHTRVRNKFLEPQNVQDYVSLEVITIFMFK